MMSSVIAETAICAIDAKSEGIAFRIIIADDFERCFNFLLLLDFDSPSRDKCLCNSAMEVVETSFCRLLSLLVAVNLPSESVGR